MKKILCCFLNPLFLLLCTIIPLNTYAVDDYEMPKNSGGTPTVTVIGTRGGGGGGGGVGPILGGGGGGRGAGGGGAGPGMSEGQEAKAEAARKRECNRKKAESKAALDICTANRLTEFSSTIETCRDIGGGVSGGIGGGTSIQIRYEPTCERNTIAVRDAGVAVCKAQASVRYAGMTECF